MNILIYVEEQAHIEERACDAKESSKPRGSRRMTLLRRSELERYTKPPKCQETTRAE